ncbi:hypothetical protein GQ651_12090 [Alphaproteobacteria bacterium GH1-50]|uniref:Uncharacterized protein n=1 Tax=Kangsaoukella pontilimi TaxID=2691042 RepID=A0A7C9IGV7_9RHOB|nr:hypothetical protein [Kangsaoukella pontilimi]MXQ08588.1 hypothetical protein [Kangsaoukella pontilimi]
MGGYQTEDPALTDVLAVRTSVGYTALYARNFEINLSLADRIDEEGGATDTFAGTLAFEYQQDGVWSQSSVPINVTLFNLDGPEGLGPGYSTYAFWTAEFEPFLGEDASTVFGATILGRSTGLYNNPGTGSASYSGRMQGEYYAAGSAAAAVDGQVNFTLDIAEQTISGRVSSIQTPKGQLNDIEFEPRTGYPPPSPPPYWHTPYNGPAVSVPGTGDAGAPEMNGWYSMLPYRQDQSEIGGVLSVTDQSNLMIGGMITRKE